MAFAGPILGFVQGAQKNQALRAEASRIDEQGNLAFQESQEAADMMVLSNRQFEEKQALAYMKNGVSLEGSPLLVLERTREIGAAEVQAVRDQGRARFRLALDTASQLREQGRAAITGAAIGAGASFFKAKAKKDTTSETGTPPKTISEASRVEASKASSAEASDRFWSRTGTA